jgi:glycosyltransferase involved in cell wall biosynthesis
VGGVTQHIHSLAQRLIGNGFNVRVIDLHFDHTKVLHHYELEEMGPTSMARLFLRRADIVHFHVSTLQQKRHLLSLLAVTLLLPRQKSVISVHSGQFPGNEVSNRTVVRAPILRLLSRRIETWVALNEELYNYFQEYLNVSKCVRGSSYVPLGEAGTFPFPYKLPKPFRILTSGYLTPNYGYEEVIDAWRYLRDYGIYTELYIVTYGHRDDEYARRLQDKIEDAERIFLYDGLAHPEFMDLLTKSSLYVRHTARDVFGITIAEALERGIPALATDVCARAPGCITYESGFFESLLHALQYCHQYYWDVCEHAESVRLGDEGSFDIYNELYTDLLRI